MSDESPEAPIVLWDGECGFCRAWIEHWRTRVPDTVDFAPYQQIDAERLEAWGLHEEDFASAMHFVDGDEDVHRGAAAVAELLSHADELRYSLFTGAYRGFEPFRLLVDAAYRFIAARRVLAARLTRMLWGEPHRQTFRFARFAFIRMLAVATFVAFWSMWRQIVGLIGSDGILPATDFLDRISTYVAANDLGTWEKLTTFPTVFWLDSSDAMLGGVCLAGMVGSAALFLGIIPRLVIPLLWVGYLSVMAVGQVFLGYQWDALLLEALAVGWFVAPWRLWPSRENPASVSPTGRWLVWLLLFKLMFLAGWVKVRADAAWRNLEALDYHFWTQPIPNALAWYADRLPDAVKSAGVAGTLVIELGAPLLIFAPRRLRHLGALGMIGLQVGIGLTGTYGFFNLLTIALCLTLLDDRFVRWISRGLLTSTTGPTSTSTPRRVARATSFLVVGALVVLPLLRGLGLAEVRPPDAIRSLRTFNGYGLFARMTKTRPEIGVEVSDDGASWRALDFRWKPTAVDEPLRPTTFHMPRLDWQMWFAALGTCQRNPWFQQFQRRILQGSDDVERLLEGYDPDREPPRFVRTPLYEYEFGDETTWTRRRVGQYCPPLTLDPQGNLNLAE